MIINGEDMDCLTLLTAAANGAIDDTDLICEALEEDAEAVSPAAETALLESLASGDDSFVRVKALWHPNMDYGSVKAISEYDGYDEFVRAEALLRLHEGW